MSKSEGFNKTKYIIQKSDGSPVDPEARYFVLRYDHKGKDSKIARSAISFYASSIFHANRKFHDELTEAISEEDRLDSLKIIKTPDISLPSGCFATPEQVERQIRFREALDAITKECITGVSFYSDDQNLKVGDLINYGAPTYNIKMEIDSISEYLEGVYLVHAVPYPQ